MLPEKGEQGQITHDGHKRMVTRVMGRVVPLHSKFLQSALQYGVLECMCVCVRERERKTACVSSCALQVCSWAWFLFLLL